MTDARTADPRPVFLASGRQIGRVLRGHLRGRELILVGILVLFLLEAAMVLVFPYVIGGIVNDVESDASVDALPWRLSALVAAAVLSGVLAWISGTALARLTEAVVAELREEFVSSVLHLPRARMEAVGAGDLVTRASDDIAHISETLPDVLPRLAVSVCTLVLVAAGMGAVDPRFLLAFALTAPVYALTFRNYMRRAPAAYACDRAAESSRGEQILETMHLLPTVRAFRLNQRQMEGIRLASWRTVRWAMRTRIVQNRLFGGLNVAEMIGLLTVLSVGVWLAATGAASAGAVTAASLLFLRTVAPLDALLFLADDLQQAIASLSRVIGVREGGLLDARAEPLTGSGEDAAVALEGVSFTYGNVPVLSDISLRISAGEVVALVGASGSGKSTLASLIAGSHAPTHGTLTRNVPRADIAMLPQETHVFAGTLRDNLSIAIDHLREAPADGTGHTGSGILRGEHLDGRLREALHTVDPGDSLATLTDGLDTVLGSGGTVLTAAHEQLLGLARILLADPRFVILDEPTAEADAADSGLLDRAAAEVIRGRTAVVIAHRLKQARAADWIVLLDRGRILEQGSHAELISNGQRYAALWEAYARR